MKKNKQALLNLQKIKLGATASLTTMYVCQLNSNKYIQHLRHEM